MPQILCFTPLPGVRPRLLFLAYRYACCFRQRPFHIAWYPPLCRAKDCPSLPLWVAALPLRLSCSEVQGPPVLLSYYIARVISCGPGALSSCHPSWVVSLVLQNLLGASCNPSGHTRCAVLLRDALFILASALARRLGLFPAKSFHGSLSWSEGVVSFAFVTGFVAKTQAPPLLIGLRASLYRPNQRETIAMGDCYILCGWSGVTWFASAVHRQRCERFSFAARCNR